MLKVAPLVPLLPVAAAVVVGLGARVLRGRSHWPVILGVAGALFCSLIVFGVVAHIPDGRQTAFVDTYRLYSWIIPAAGFSVDVDFRIDPLTAVMLVMVCTVSLLVIIYSRDYMRVTPTASPDQHEGELGGGQLARQTGETSVAREHHPPLSVPQRGYERFFAFMGLFVFSMCTLVLAGNFLLLYLGWEAVGLCSYLLIGFYYRRPAAAAAAKKAFIVNRIGDFGFGLGILFIYLWLSPLAPAGRNPLEYTFVFENIGRLASWQCHTIALLLFCGAVGKSAQFPLYVWLPDAMEGPSPVSALIHAATMVTAGVYMVVRCGPIFVRAPWALAIVAAVGATTALYAATIALAQYDMKRILAYSTISQLGYMFLGAGVFAADSAVFHLFTHAFFKALLFLGAGSVMHAMGGVIDIRRFSGLRRIMPATCWTFVIGSLALAGFPLFSGFFSKDEIIHAAWKANPALGAIALLTALMTAFYTFRMVFLAFWGPTRVPERVHAHESGRWMLAPLVLLAVGAFGAGYVGVSRVQHFPFFAPHGLMQQFLGPVVWPYREALEATQTPGHGWQKGTGSSQHDVAGTVHSDVFGASPLLPHAARHGEESYGLMYLSALLSVAGILAAYFLYARRREISQRMPRALPAAFEVLHNKYFVDELYDAVIVRPIRMLGVWFYAFDRFFIDGLVWMVSAIPRALGFALRGLQNGAIQSYGATMAAGLVLLAIIAWLAR